MGDSTKVISCNCEHEYQDNRYGKGRRLHNKGKGKSPGGPPTWNCTICDTRKEA